MARLTQDERHAITTAMKDEGVEADKILGVLERLESTYPARSVNVSQSAQVVEEGATMTGLVIRGNL